MKFSTSSLFILLMAALLLVAPASAQEEPPLDTPTDDEVNAVAKNMYCPVCENVPLDVCPTLACEQWRAQIRELLEQGYDEQEVYEYFVLQYGDRVLAEPPRSGLNWLIYIVPPVVILIGMIGLYVGLRNWRQAALEPGAQDANSAGTQHGSSDEYMARLEEEIAKRQ